MRLQEVGRDGDTGPGSDSEHQDDSRNREPLEKLAAYNKFAVSAAAVVGSWESASGESVQYSKVYMCNNAGRAYALSIKSLDATDTRMCKGSAKSAKKPRHSIQPREI